MPQLRITKYDPTHRDAGGAYTRDEWTSYSDVGQVFGGRTLTLSEYEAVEAAYVNAASAFLREAGVHELFVRGLESTNEGKPGVAEGSSVGVEQLPGVVRALLREKFWCRLESETAYLHVGWDYYLYVGIPTPCPAAQSASIQAGLFVEPCPSPYADRAASASADRHQSVT
jgi:hypothetical protein